MRPERLVTINMTSQDVFSSTRKVFTADELILKHAQGNMSLCLEIFPPVVQAEILQFANEYQNRHVRVHIAELFIELFTLCPTINPKYTDSISRVVWVLEAESNLVTEKVEVPV